MTIQGKPSFVVDTMTNIIDKIALVEYCHANDIKIISSMSPGAKADPTRIQVVDISETIGKYICHSFNIVSHYLCRGSIGTCISTKIKDAQD